MRLRDAAHSLGGAIEIVEARRGRCTEIRPRTQPHPRFDDDAENAFAADEQAIRARTRAGARQPERLQHAGRRHDAQRLDELVDVRVQRRVVSAAARGDPPAQGRELERLRKVTQRSPLGLSWFSSDGPYTPP